MSEAARTIRPPAPERPDNRDESGVHRIVPDRSAPEQKKKPDLKIVPPADDAKRNSGLAYIKPSAEAGMYSQTLVPPKLETPDTEFPAGYPQNPEKPLALTDAEKMAVERDFTMKQRIPRSIENIEAKSPGFKDKQRIEKGGVDYAAEVQSIKNEGWPPKAAEAGAVAAERAAEIAAATHVEQKGPQLIEQAEERVPAVGALDKARTAAPDNHALTRARLAETQRKLEVASGAVKNLESGKGGVNALAATLKEKYGYDVHATSAMGELRRGVRSLFDAGYRAMLKTYKMRSQELDQARTAEASLQNAVDQAEADRKF